MGRIRKKWQSLFCTFCIYKYIWQGHYQNNVCLPLFPFLFPCSYFLWGFTFHSFYYTNNFSLPVSEAVIYHYIKPSLTVLPK